MTANTVLELDFRSGSQAEIQGVGFDIDDSPPSGRLFKVYGTQAWGIQTYDNYAASAPNWKHYVIPVGSHFTGNQLYLTFVNDHDVAGANGESYYSNVRVYEACDPVAITSHPIDRMVPEGDPVVFEVTASGSQPQYQWLKDSSAISGANSSRLTLPNVQTSNQGTYSCVASNACGPSDTSSSATLTVTPAPGSPPEIDSMTPDVLPKGQVTMVTLRGRDLFPDDATISVPSGPLAPGDPVRYTPLVTVDSFSTDGRRLTLRIDSRDTRIVDFYTLLMSNEGGEDRVPFRVVPDEPVVDFYTPSEPQPGNTYLLNLIGANLAGASVTTSDPANTIIFDVDNNEEELLGAFLQILDGTPIGDLDLIVNRPGGPFQPLVLPLSIVSNDEESTLQTVNLLEAPPGEGGQRGPLPSVYFQDFVMGDGQAIPRLAPESDICFSIYRYRSRQRRTAIAFDSQTGEILSRVLAGLEIGDRIPLEVEIFSLFLKLEMQIGSGCDLTDAWACFSISAAFELLGQYGQYFEVSGCMHSALGGSLSTFQATTGGVFGSAHFSVGSGDSIGDSSCLEVEVEDPVPVDGSFEGEIAVVGCCESRTPINVQITGSTFEGLLFGLNLDESLTVADVEAPPLCLADQLGMHVLEVSFENDIPGILKDMQGSAEEILDPVWSDSNLDGTPDTPDNAVAYVRGKTVEITTKLHLDNPPQGGTRVKIRAAKEGFVVLESGWEEIVWFEKVAKLTAIDVLPNETSADEPLELRWSYTTDGTNYVEFGSTTHPFYVTLAQPLVSPPGTPAMATRHLTMTALYLSIGSGGASTVEQATRITWDQFAGPANISTWGGGDLLYYPTGSGFDDCQVNALPMLTSPDHRGQCGAFAFLLQDALAANGIESEPYLVRALPYSMLIHRWVPVGQSWPRSDWPYSFVLREEPSGKAGMVDDPYSGNVYGDLQSVAGLPGQNSATPSEKAFFQHWIVKVLSSQAGCTGEVFYDPSYGRPYCSAQEFQTTAVWGFFLPITSEDPYLNVAQISASSPRAVRFHPVSFTK